MSSFRIITELFYILLKIDLSLNTTKTVWNIIGLPHAFTKAFYFEIDCKGTTFF